VAIDELDRVALRFARIAPAVDYWSLRVLEERGHALEVRQGVLAAPWTWYAQGASITVIRSGGEGYAATSDLSASGLRDAAAKACAWAEIAGRLRLFDPLAIPRSAHRGAYFTPLEQSWATLDTAEKVALLKRACDRLKVHPRILDWSAHLLQTESEGLLVSSVGTRIHQRIETIHPGLVAVANDGEQTQCRTGGGADLPRQGGLEQLDLVGFPDSAETVAAQALQLLEAPECPTGTLDLVLAPSQMVLQVHESIGHPLELDRILGDERNYAGTSFVTPEMFGSYRYGSELLNVTFDPGVAGELAGYRFDDEGTQAERSFLIRNGVLERPLGGICSQARAGLPGVACARACSWDRPPIDRMANLNLEPGTSPFGELIADVEHGVYMETNRSWSIDDSRNKFQFGCEWGRRIEAGELAGVVRNPGYRGISANFWRSLDAVGDGSTVAVGGVQTCGKGEPNQAIRVGHAVPACRFRRVEIFGGGAG